MDEETKEDSLMKKTGIDGESLRKIKLVQVVNYETTSPSTGWLYSFGREPKSRKKGVKRS